MMEAFRGRGLSLLVTSISAGSLGSRLSRRSRRQHSNHRRLPCKRRILENNGMKNIVLSRLAPYRAQREVTESCVTWPLGGFCVPEPSQQGSSPL